MTQPGHHLLHSSQNAARRHVGAVDHHDRHTQAARGGQFGLGATAAGILGNQMGDGVIAHQRSVGVHIKRPTRHDDRSIGQGQRTGRRIDQSQQVMVCGLDGKGIKVLLSNGQKHPRAFFGQNFNSGRYISDVEPFIAARRFPRGAFKPRQVHARLSAGVHCMSAHLRGKGVGRIDHMGDALVLQVPNKPFNPAEAAHARRQRLNNWAGGAARVGKHRIGIAVSQSASKAGGFGGPTEQKGACHG